jgi:hypothetical protein
MKYFWGVLFVFAFSFCGRLNAQEVFEKEPPEFIKSVVFKTLGKPYQFPILEEGERMELQFDDLSTSVSDYYYKISYYNHDWTPSNLFQNDYLKGYDNLRIETFETSFNTIQTYTHYSLSLPNPSTDFLLPGNYSLDIYNAEGQLLFRRRFIKSENTANVAVGVFRPRDLNFYMTHQTVQFSVQALGEAFRNPEGLVKVVLLQNEQWASAISGLRPQYVNGGILEYRYDATARFEGGNEFLFFDTKDIRVATPNVSYVALNERYESYLFTDPIRANFPYTYGPDINGDFEIRTVQGTQQAAIEADYSWVHFSLSTPFELSSGALHVLGKFNNYEASDENKMQYNPALEGYELSLLLKQGFYNYRYVVQNETGVGFNVISGTHAQTENRYLVLVYYRPFGALHDALVGYGTASSFELLN